MSKYKYIFFAFSGILVIASIISLAIFRLNLGVDFTGGSVLEVQFKNQAEFSNQEIKDSLKDLSLGDFKVRQTAEKTIIIKLKNIDEETHQKILNVLADKIAVSIVKTEDQIDSQTDNNKTAESQADLKTESDSLKPNNLESPLVETGKSEAHAVLEELRYDSVGPIIGSELQRKALIALIIVLIIIILYIAWAFRKIGDVTRDKKEAFKFGAAAVIALFHDVLIVIGLFAVLGKFLAVELDVSFVAAILTVLGYSVNDTIVIFDRLRENLLARSANTFAEATDKSIKETMSRSLNTAMGTLLVLFAILLFGGASIRYFALALIVGIAFGTYSSICIASQILVVWQGRK